MTATASAAGPLPTPNDVPEGPASIAAPGGAALPLLGAPVVADAPAISAVGDVCLPDETLVIAGDKLSGAALRIWMEGRLEDLPPLRAGDDRLEAVVPKAWPASTMLVWPVRGQQAGRPIRINGATVWWAWPPRITEENAAGPTVAWLMGKNLKIGSGEPRACLQGGGSARWLRVLAAGPYQLTVELPGGLRPGSYQLFAHNGSGGAYGWSEPMRIEVFPSAAQRGLAVFEVDRFGATPDDGRDDAAAIQRAIDAAAKAGGGTVRFSAGLYHLGSTLHLPDVPGGGIYLLGAGMGEYDAKTQTVRGGTTLRFLSGCSTLDNRLNAKAGSSPTSAIAEKNAKSLVHVDCRFSSLRDLTVIGGHEGVVRSHHDHAAARKVAVRVTKHDVTLDHTRVVMLDLRPQVPQEKRQDLQIYDPALQLIAPGRANIVVRHCEFHSAGGGIEIGSLQRGHVDDGFPDPSTDYVRIEKCLFRGYSPVFYKEPDVGEYANLGDYHEGIQIFNGKYAAIEGCDFAGADRRGGKTLNRSILACNTSTRDIFIANNRSHDVGLTCPRKDRYINQGEQILFHFCYPHGGYFDVVEAGLAEVAVNPADARSAGRVTAPHVLFTRVGSRVLEEVGANDHWLLYVSAGKGVGQHRVVIGVQRRPDRVVLRLDRPWRVVPDRTSRVTLAVAYRQNIICDNSIDAGFIDPRCKVAGILFWFNASDNVIAGNRLRNVGYAVGFNSGFRNPCCWNLVRDNVAEQMGGITVECPEPTFYIDSCRTPGGPGGPLYQPGSDVAGWYSVGNAYRSNQGHGAQSAAFVYAALDPASAPQLPKQDQAGVIMPVLEHNRFSGVQRGIVVNRGTIWPVIRDNTVETIDGKGPAVYDQNGAPKAVSPSLSGGR
jgi:hypothetical protein